MAQPFEVHIGIDGTPHTLVIDGASGQTVRQQLNASFMAGAKVTYTQGSGMDLMVNWSRVATLEPRSIRPIGGEHETNARLG